MNEIELKALNEIVTEDYLENLRKYEEIKVAFEVAKSEVENQLKEFMVANNIDYIDDDVHGIRIKYKKPSTRKTVDTELMKKHDIYESYVKETPVKDSVIITVRYDD